MEKENWINEILESTNGMSAAVPDTKLFSKIQKKIKIENTVSQKWIWAAAASIAILISVNIKFVFLKSTKQKATTEMIAAYLSKSNQLY